MSAPLDAKRIVSFTLITIMLSLSAPVYGEEEADEVNYSDLFETDIAKNHTALWKIFEDTEQEPAKLLKERNIRAIFVGRYESFKDRFELNSYSKLSVYRSPFQAKILLIDYYLKKLIDLKHIKKTDKIYLTIHDFKKDYFNLYPHVYKKRANSKKKSIIPNKLFKIDFYEDEKHYDAYQQLFDSISEAFKIKAVKNDLLMPELLDKASRLKLTGKNKFHFYKLDATVNELKVKEALVEFFETMKELVSIISVTRFYELKYQPKIGLNFAPRSERIITVNVLYNPDSDFDYYDMDVSKKAALIHEYFFREGITLSRGSPLLSSGAANLIEVQNAFNSSVFPPENMFEFEYDSDEDYYHEAVDDFYDDLDDVMEVTEELLSEGEISLDLLRLTATVDEVALIALFDELKTDITEYRKK